jgi:hypothetical protein
MAEIAVIERRAVDRPVADLPREGDALPNGNGHPQALPLNHRVQEALGAAYLGITCPNCGSDKVIRSGACGVCTQCGGTTGCS